MLPLRKEMPGTVSARVVECSRTKRTRFFQQEAKMDWRLFIRMAKADERVARAKYQLAARSAKSQAIKDILNKLAYEEEIHLGVLEQFEKDLRTLLAAERRH